MIISPKYVMDSGKLKKFVDTKEVNMAMQSGDKITMIPSFSAWFVELTYSKSTDWQNSMHYTLIY
jgi:hypothetical protein